MNFPPLRAALLGVVAVALTASWLQSQEPDREKTIADLQKQIQGLRNTLQSLEQTLPMPTKVPVAGVPATDWNKAFPWRSIGPANMGGRITALAIIDSDPAAYYVATASGGLLKTVNNGSTFEHQFDREATVSIGAVAVAPSNRNIVWIGTGEANPRNSVSFGDGVHLSTDGGKTWKNKGLPRSFQIGKIVIHPKDPNIVYVGALGRLYGPNEERGLYKTTDGGKTWQRSLFVDENTGVLDIVMHPTNPEILIAATWERQRDEFDSFRGNVKAHPATDVYAPSKVHGSGSGLHKSTDGGKTWKKLTQGLPKANLGRIGFDWHRKNPNLIFASIDSDKAGGGLPPSQAFLGVQSSATPQGLRVDAVVAKGPAEKAGLLKGDRIASVDGKEYKSPAQLVAGLQPRKPGDTLKLAIVRDKDKRELEVVLAARPSDDPNQRGSLGIQIEEADAGILVTEITEKGSADKAGLKVDDLLLAMDGTKLDSTRTLFKLLFAKKIGDAVKLEYRRGMEKKEVQLALEAPSLGAPGRPYSGRLGGQRENVQDQQGPDSDHTGGVFKSVDAGETWTRVNSLNERPFYFSVVRVDPNDENTIYFLGINLYRSTDGGKTFTAKDLNKGLHSDHHDLWIDPRDSRHLRIGSDGGLYASYDRGANWEHLNHMSLGQFYHVAVDNRTPYHVYGGLQDNGSWGGPSQTLRPSGPTNFDYQFVSGGDGFVCRVDPNNPDLIYAESQDGTMSRRNLKTGESAAIRAKVQLGSGAFRFNWNTPFILSHHNSSIFYCAANYVFRSIKQGDDLKIISPEITRTKRGSASAIAESPKSSDILWVGSDDGAVWVTKDGAKTWTNVSDRFKAAGLPGPRWVSAIEPSRVVAGRCYVVFDAHRSDDDAAYVFVTEDFGQTWKSLRGNLPVGSTRVLREDIVNPNLLYLGTEFALFASVNRGESWFKIHGSRLPTVAIHEIAQPTTAPEIVAATHGRGLWVLQVSSLRQVKAEHFRDAAALFAPRKVVRWRLDPTLEGMFRTGTREFVGDNPERHARIEFVLPKKAEQISLKAIDLEGRTVREFDLAKEKDSGFHGIAWDLTAGEAKKQGKGGGKKKDAVAGFGPGTVLPAGVYRIQLEVDGQSFAQTLTVEADPRNPRPNATTDDAEEDRQLRRMFQRLAPSLIP